jgi:hypothetical protein
MNIAKHYPRIAQELYGKPWLILPATHKVLVESFEAHRSGQLHGANVRMIQDNHRKAIGGKSSIQADDISSEAEALLANEKSPELPPGYARISVNGIIGKRLSGLDMLCGGCDINNVADQIDTAMKDTNIHTLIFDFCTPAGVFQACPR